MTFTTRKYYPNSSFQNNTLPNDNTDINQTPDLNDRLENVHYFPDEQPFQEPFTDGNNKETSSSHRFQLVENGGTKETMRSYDGNQKLPRPLNKSVHFAEDPSMSDKHQI